MTETGIRTDTADGVLTITLDRVHKRNALHSAAQLRLAGVLEAAAVDESLRVVHLIGAGADFCGGADWVSTNEGGARPRPAHMIRQQALRSSRIIELLMGIQLPVVATVRGVAAGIGCHLALAADFAVADEAATFWEPFMHRGFTTDSGSTWLLPRMVGLARARRMLLLGEKVSGRQAADWGLIHEAVPADAVDTSAHALVDRLRRGPTVALGLTKQQLVRSSDGTLARALVDETFNLELSSRTADFREGLAAFTARRQPEFEGR